MALFVIVTASNDAEYVYSYYLAMPLGVFSALFWILGAVRVFRADPRSVNSEDLQASETNYKITK